MSKLGNVVEKVVPWIQFSSAMAGPVKDFLRALFRRTGGNVEQAKVVMKLLTDEWADWDEQKARIDRELAELKAQGK